MRKQRAVSDMKSPVKLKAEYEIAEQSIIHETYSEHSDHQPIPDKLPLAKKSKDKIQGIVMMSESKRNRLIKS